MRCVQTLGVPSGTVEGFMGDDIEDPDLCDVDDPFPDDVTSSDGVDDGNLSMKTTPGTFVPDDVEPCEPCEERDWNSSDRGMSIDFITTDKSDPSVVEEPEGPPELDDLDDKEIVNGDLWWT